MTINLEKIKKGLRYARRVEMRIALLAAYDYETITAFNNTQLHAAYAKLRGSR